MNIKDLADLITEHTTYCATKYNPIKFPHWSLEKALRFQEKNIQSLTHFAMWLDKIKLKETK
jgi:hypothetical protein